MEKLFDLNEFDSYKEDNRREVKSAKNGQMDMVELLF